MGPFPQDCFGGCTDPSQGFHGLLDEVRLWNVARSQSDILRTMRATSGLEAHPGLVAWWQFNEPGGPAPCAQMADLT